MSKLFRKLIQDVFCGNPYLYQEMLEARLHADEQWFYYERQKWITGEKNPSNSPLKEWYALGKPNRKNTYLKLN